MIKKTDVTVLISESRMLDQKEKKRHLKRQRGMFYTDK